MFVDAKKTLFEGSWVSQRPDGRHGRTLAPDVNSRGCRYDTHKLEPTELE